MKRVGIDILDVTLNAMNNGPTGKSGYVLDKAVGLKKWLWIKGKLNLSFTFYFVFLVLEFSFGF